jgi:tetratricopeptide (TPR) repeat protein
LYKNDYTQTNRPALRQAVAYYDSLAREAPLLQRGLGELKNSQSPEQHDIIAFLDARAHYINGVGYYEHDSVVEACKEYLKGLEVMEEHFEEEELVGNTALFTALAYVHLSVLYSDFYLHEQTISLAKHSLSYFQKQDSTSWHLAWVLNKIGGQYEMIGTFDSANYYYNQALEAIHDTTSLIYRDIASHQAMLDYKIDNHRAHASLSSLFHLLSASENERESLARYLNICEILLLEQQFDSAWKYLNTVFYKTSNIASKKQAAEWLVEICKVQGNNDEAIKYAEFLVPFANQEENKSETKSKLAELYNEFSQNKLERIHKKEIRSNRKVSIMVYSGLFFIILIVAVLYYNNKRKKQHLENQIDEVKQTYNIEQKALSSRLKKSNETLRELKEQIKQQNDNLPLLAETHAANFTDEPICRLILERVKEGQFKSQMNCTMYKDYALNKEQIIALRSAADHHFNHFTARLVQAYPDLTKSDLDYCCLYLLGLTDADVAALMQRAYSTVSDRSRKLKTVFGSNNLLSITLHSIANKDTTN